MKTELYCDPEVGLIAEILEDRLYFAALSDEFVEVCEQEMCSGLSSVCYFTVDDEFTYTGFYSDFGPLNLSCVYKYCVKVNNFVKFKAKGTEIIHYTSMDPHLRVNAAFLMGCYAVIYLEQNAMEVYYKLVHGEPFM